MRVIRVFLTIIGAIAVLAIIALVVGYYLFSLTPPIKAKMTPVVVSAGAAKSLDQKLEVLDSAIKSAVAVGEREVVSLTITEEEANSKLIEILAEGELPLKEISINFEELYLMVYTVVDTPGPNTKIGIIAQTEVVEGKPRIAIVDFDVGKLVLPNSVDGNVEDMLNIVIRLRLGDLPLEVTEIEVSDGQLSIMGVTKIIE